MAKHKGTSFNFGANRKPAKSTGGGKKTSSPRKGSTGGKGGNAWRRYNAGGKGGSEAPF